LTKDCSFNINFLFKFKLFINN